MTRRPSRFRRWLKWSGLFSCVILSLCFVISMIWSVGVCWFERAVGVSDGMFVVGWRFNPDYTTHLSLHIKPKFNGISNVSACFDGARFWRAIGNTFHDGGQNGWASGTPLVPLIVLVFLPTAVLWYVDRRSPLGHCKHCGYDLTGNESGVCPECGTELVKR
ncbi:MAG: hypothetical protein HOP29_10490 [Phycisphaerales bacterium]|nr:hypothetical protein [Phycisphaerales bacterium]